MDGQVPLPFDAHDGATAGDVVELARCLVATPSVNPRLESGGAGEGDVARLAEGWLRRWGFQSRLIEVEPGRWNVVAIKGDGRPATILNGHLDTVGVAGMTVSPFEPAMKEGRLYGRGACDMKGGVAAALAAAHTFAGSRGRGTLVVALTADEEHSSVGMQAFAGDPPPAERAIVCEPTGLAVMPAHKGFLWLTATFHGRAAHGSRPDVGIDAVRHAGLYMAELEELHQQLADGATHPLLGGGSFHFGPIEGGTAPSVYPDRCAVQIERRTLPHEDESSAEDFRRALGTLERRHRDVRGEITLDLYRPGSDVDPEHAVVYDLQRALAAVGHEPKVEGMTAWVDAAYLNKAGIPAVCFGPGSIAQAHSADEWVDVEQLRAATRVLERFLGV